MKRLGMIVAVAVVGGVIGCTTMTPQQQGTVTGAAIGAAAGAGIAAFAGWRGGATLYHRERRPAEPSIGA